MAKKKIPGVASADTEGEAPPLPPVVDLELADPPLPPSAPVAPDLEAQARAVGFESCRAQALAAVQRLDDKLKAANGLALDDIRWLQVALARLTP